jgi:threonine dehydrogenase-like Zn-dependent dehydrogenase
VAALADVYACAVHALHRVPVGAGNDVVIIGSGAVGLALGQLARRSGAFVTVVGRRPEALAAAYRLGAADATVDATGGDDLSDRVAAVTSGREVGTVFEAVGGAAGRTVRQAVEVVAPGGVVGILGAFAGDVAVPYRIANRKEVTLRWCNAYATWHGRREFSIALDRLAEGQLDASSLITHRFGLEEIAEAFRVADDRRCSGAIKVMIEP